MVDFHWNVLEPWTIVSVSGNCESNGGGGTLQVLFKNFLSALLGNLSTINYFFGDKNEKLCHGFQNLADMADEWVDLQTGR